MPSLPTILGFLRKSGIAWHFMLLAACHGNMQPEAVVTTDANADSVQVGTTSDGYFNSLLIIDQLVLSRLSTAPSGVRLDFRNRLESLSGYMQVPVDTLVSNWISQWSNAQLVNGDVVEARSLPASELASAWADRSGLRFHLLAITHRPDLARSALGDAANVVSLGEARLVYELWDSANTRPLPFTLILEYELPRLNSTPALNDDLFAWAESFKSLERLSRQSDTYRNRLGQLVQLIFAPDNFLRLRTNEFLDIDTEWELRQFVRGETGLMSDVLPQTPQEKFKNSDHWPKLTDYLSRHEDDLVDGKHSFAATAEGGAMLGGHSLGNPDWKQGDDESHYMIFVFNTCNGCHTEINAGGNRHVFSSDDQTGKYTTTLSPFLSGNIVTGFGLPCGATTSYPWCRNTGNWNERLRRTSLLSCYAQHRLECADSSVRLLSDEAAKLRSYGITTDRHRYH